MELKIAYNKIIEKYDSTIFKNFSYQFNSKGLYVLLGPSGSGKTTLLNILCGLTDINNGQVIIGDKIYDKR